jgi:hypothetical protein
MKILLLLLGGFSALTSLHWLQQPTLSAAPVQSTLVAAEARKITELNDVRIDESSGLGASRRYPNCWWTHNDSGDEARLFLVNEQGRTLATVNLPTAHADDWEDMTIAGTGQNSWIYIGDIGDNLEARSNITIYRVHEPKIDLQSTLPPTLNALCESMTLRYPDGAHNAETLVANARGQLMIVTKTAGPSQFFVTSQPFKNGTTQTLQRIGEHQFGSTEPGNRSVRNRLTTGGDWSPDGSRFVVSTYGQAHEWQLQNKQLHSIFKNQPRVRELPPIKQCEAIAYSADGKRALITSEGSPCPLWELGTKRN